MIGTGEPMERLASENEGGLVAHACGAWHGLTYCNSLEAFGEAIRRFRIIEMDVCVSLDGQFVVAHAGKAERVTEQVFLRGRHAKGTAFNLDRLLEMMKENRGVRIMLDYQHDYQEEQADERFESLLNRLRQSGVADQIILEVYSRRQVELMKSLFPELDCIYGFQDVKKLGPGLFDFPEGFDGFMEYAKEMHIDKVSIANAEVQAHPEWGRKLHEANILLFSCAWNTCAEYRAARRLGVDWVTTDWLVPNARHDGVSWWGTLLKRSSKYGWKAMRLMERLFRKFFRQKREAT